MFEPDFTDAALENIAETGADWAHDLERLRDGMTESDLLALCLEGADADREQGWREYVETLAAVGPARDPAEEAAYAADRAYDQAKDDALTGDL